MVLSEQDRAKIRAEEEYRHEVFVDLNRLAKRSWWDWLNSPISIWALGSVVLGLISFLYAEHSDSLKKEAEERAIAYAIQVRLQPVEELLPNVLSAGVMDDDSRYRISNSFTGKMEQAPDSFGEIGVPGLLFQYAAVSGRSEAAGVAQYYLELLVPLESEDLYSRGAGFADVRLTDKNRELLNQLKMLVEQARDLSSDAIR